MFLISTFCLYSFNILKIKCWIYLPKYWVNSITILNIFVLDNWIKVGFKHRWLIHLPQDTWSSRLDLLQKSQLVCSLKLVHVSSRNNPFNNLNSNVLVGPTHFNYFIILHFFPSTESIHLSRISVGNKERSRSSAHKYEKARAARHTLTWE